MAATRRKECVGAADLFTYAGRRHETAASKTFKVGTAPRTRLLGLRDGAALLICLPRDGHLAGGGGGRVREGKGEGRRK